MSETPRVPLAGARLVVAPMAGGPSTVELAVATARAGAFPFLAGGYLTPERLRGDVDRVRSSTAELFGVNVFVPSPEPPDARADTLAYAARLGPWASSSGVELGEPRWDDDHYAAKVDLLVELAPAVVSFTFGWPRAHDVERLQAAECEVWVTVNDPAEVEWAGHLGVDGVLAQGWEAGGHRGGPVDTGAPQLPTRELLRQVRAISSLPVIAAGGVADARHVRVLLDAGATAVACGTVFLTADEAGTSQVHRHELTARSETVVTRCFTGRSARSLTTTWTDLFTDDAPAAYPPRPPPHRTAARARQGDRAA